MCSSSSNSQTRVPLDVSRFDELVSVCKEDFASHSAQGAPSKLQKDVARALRRMGERISEEEVLDDCGYSVDIRVLTHPQSRVVIEVDGPSHFVREYDPASGRETQHCDGSTMFKHRILTSLSWTVLHVPYHEWQRLPGQNEQAEYIKKLIDPGNGGNSHDV